MKCLRVLVIASVSLAVVAPFAADARSRTQSHSPAYTSAERKIEFLEQNGERARPQQTPTVVYANEWNAFLNEGGVQLPDGVSNVNITTNSSSVEGHAVVDFDALTANAVRGNPLMAIFTGQHDVVVSGQLTVSGGMGTFQVERVSLDGVPVPRTAVEYFANRYLRRRYGDAVGMNSRFRMPARIDLIGLGQNRASITQK